MKFEKIGVIGQGFVGGSLSDNLEERGYEIIRYSLDKEYVVNKDKIKECDLVFIAVPTPTINLQFNDSSLVASLSLVKEGAVAVIKSTVPYYLLYKYAEYFNNINILYSPEFLDADNAKKDTDNPSRVVIGLYSGEQKKLAKDILKVLPRNKEAEVICSYAEASFIKYAHNCFFYTKNMFFNMLYDVVDSVSIDFDVDYSVIRDALILDKRIEPVHTSAIHKGGRGAGGACLVKDFAEFINIAKKTDLDSNAFSALKKLMKYNKKLLVESGKDLDIVKEVYG